MSFDTDKPLQDHDSLKDAFARFSEASERLEQKYQTLLEETKVLREALRQKDLEIKRQERLAMLGETAAAIAHEVRNPLGAIKLFISLLRQDVADKPESIKLVDQVDTSIAALDHVVSNILQFSKERKLTVTPVNVHSIIQEQLLSFPRSESNQATFALELTAAPYLLGNEASLRQVFYNLFHNALQATSYQGHITIRTSERADSNLVITITDSGPGIPEDIQDKIFEPFVTSKNEGTGLGLAIVKQIVEQHGGMIDAANTGSGAMFQIVLPKNFKGEQQ